MENELCTDFAPAERLSIEKINIQAAGISADPLLTKILDAIPDIVLILNHQRQVIYNNRALFEGVDAAEDQALGFRPGELLDCIHAFESQGGCGTTKFCSVCGAVQAILASQKGLHENRECRVTRRNGDALDFRVFASPLDINGERFTIFTITDISHEKRRQALERIFFHDLLNTTSSLVYTSHLLKSANPGESSELIGRVDFIANTLNDEIQAQRTLNAAEDDELPVMISLVDVGPVLHEIIELHTSSLLAKDRKIVTSPDMAQVAISTDRVLLKRVISNMVKNALEGCRPESTVTVGATLVQDAVQIWVQNPGYMSREVQLQIFQRSFSTKGPGRGLGTYGIKLLTERYLKGKTTFSVSPEKGVTFSITLPLTYD